jgi:TatA/E family protein of Tat protein translocase
MITPTTALVVAGIALLVFGPKQLPELARGIGRALGEFKKGMNNLNNPEEPPPEPPAQISVPADPPPSDAAAAEAKASDAKAADSPPKA